MNRFKPNLRPGPRPAAAFLIIAALLILAACVLSVRPTPQAESGVLDLSTYDPAALGPAALDGQWEFYWDRLLSPNDFAPNGDAPGTTGYLAFPGTWQGFRLDGKKLDGTGQATFRLRIKLWQHARRLELKKLDGTGQATFRLRIKLWQHARRLELRLFDITMAYKLWADGELVAQSGTVGTDAETEIPRRSLVLAEIEPKGSDLELVLQVSNHHFRQGGVLDSIEIAPPGPLQRAQNRHRAISFLFAGCLMIAAVYHLFLYYKNRKLPSALYFGIYCLLMLGYCTTSNTSLWAANLFLPPLPPALAEYFPLFCYLALGPFLYRFFKSLYPQEIHTIVQHIVDIRLAIFVILLPFAPDYNISQYIALAMLASALYGIYYVQRLMVCVWRGRNGAGLLLTGSVVFLLTSLNDTLAHAKIINSVYLLEPGMLFLVVTQSLALAKRFTHAMEAEEKLSGELERKNASLLAEIEKRNRLERAIVNISEEERRRFSVELHDGLCQQLVGARLHASILTDQLSGTQEGKAMASLTAMLEEASNDAYRTSRGLWPVEHDPATPGPSLEDLARTIARDTGIAVTFENDCHCTQCTNPNVTTLYRIAQEALSNAVKHARAGAIRMQLRCPEQGGIALIVRDDGIGRDEAARQTRSKGGLGLSIMAHRAGMIQADLRIEDESGHGTKVTCIAPCVVAAALDQK
ncbi:7TM diverse intracellular signaling domain-containing protein [Desulfovibrio sp. Huiquan2017]|uniref:sensor histidine kinase n=1 Tax=Desulfovibrio sp. Huiquan2017 TaxID=2816861 RepID=UPI001A914752|nr:7TM diverse intracellular signaling domain-containing protein [Desulfovibrio sp. Huiquan2017]